VQAERIVVEVSRVYPEQEPGLLARRFQGAISDHAAKGYRLESWQLSRVARKPPEVAPHTLDEVIIAVFVREGP
jgi:hypothetical protein